MSLILIRHGESREKLRFHGWTDIPLSHEGQLTSIRAAELMRDSGIVFDEVHTSILRRAVHSADCIMDELNLVHVPVSKHWRLLERMAGALTGLVKKEAADKYGLETLRGYRRNVATRPPPLATDSAIHPTNPAFASLLAEVPRPLPSTESLNDVSARHAQYIEASLLPALRAGKRVLLVGHGNALRALIRDLEGLSDADAEALEVPYGIPRVYDAAAVAGWVGAPPAAGAAAGGNGAAAAAKPAAKGKKGATATPAATAGAAGAGDRYTAGAYGTTGTLGGRGRWLAEETVVRDAVARVKAQVDAVGAVLLAPSAFSIVPLKDTAAAAAAGGGAAPPAPPSTAGDGASAGAPSDVGAGDYDPLSPTSPAELAAAFALALAGGDPWCAPAVAGVHRSAPSAQRPTFDITTVDAVTGAVAPVLQAAPAFGTAHVHGLGGLGGFGGRGHVWVREDGGVRVYENLARPDTAPVAATPSVVRQVVDVDPGDDDDGNAMDPGDLPTPPLAHAGGRGGAGAPRGGARGAHAAVPHAAAPVNVLTSSALRALGGGGVGPGGMPPGVHHAGTAMSQWSTTSTGFAAPSVGVPSALSAANSGPYTLQQYVAWAGRSGRGGTVPGGFGGYISPLGSVASVASTAGSSIAPTMSSFSAAGTGTMGNGRWASPSARWSPPHSTVSSAPAGASFHPIPTAAPHAATVAAVGRGGAMHGWYPGASPLPPPGVLSPTFRTWAPGGGVVLPPPSPADSGLGGGFAKEQ